MNTKEGARKAVITNKMKYGEDYYKVITARGGRAKVPTKGFGSNPELASHWGKINSARLHGKEVKGKENK